MSRALVCLCLVLAGVLTWSPNAVASYAPADGVIFNNPVGAKASRYAIHNHVGRAVDNAPAGATIRIATWAFDDVSTTQRLLAAHQRGVNVRVVVNNHDPNPQLASLKATLGTDPSQSSFARTCTRGCRGPQPAAMHAKFFTFSRTGTATNVVMVSSTNLTEAGANRGFNDVYTVTGRRNLFATANVVFEEMALDEPVTDPYRVAANGNVEAEFFPRPGTSKATDSIYRALARTRCAGARGGAGEHGHTAIAVSMWHWEGHRGVYLARKLRALDNAGCVVRVNYGAPSTEVVRILRRPTRYGGIDLHDTRVERDGDGIPDNYVHTKYLTISGFYAGDRSAWQVFTGSQNWKRNALRFSDEVVLRVGKRDAHDRYRANFRHVRRTIGRHIRVRARAR